MQEQVEDREGFGWLRRVQEGVMDQGKVCGRDPEGEELRGERVMAFTSISQRSWMDKGTRQEARRPIKRMSTFYQR